MIYLFLSWARVRRVRWAGISSELLMCGGGARLIGVEVGIISGGVSR